MLSQLTGQNAAGAGSAPNLPGYPFVTPTGLPPPAPPPPPASHITPPPTAQHTPTTSLPQVLPPLQPSQVPPTGYQNQPPAPGLMPSNTAFSAANGNIFTTPFMGLPTAHAASTSVQPSTCPPQISLQNVGPPATNGCKVDNRMDGDTDSEADLSSVSKAKSRTSRHSAKSAASSAITRKYQQNMTHLEISPRSLAIKEYSLSSQTDWMIWVQKFEVAVDKGTNPHSEEKHFHNCMSWLPLYIDEAAYAIWQRCKNIHTDWPELKKELDMAYEDPRSKDCWKMDPYAYRWEDDVPLQTYYSNVINRVNRYDVEIRDCPAAQKVAYYTRFLNGLPDDYRQQVYISLTTKKENIEHALEICKKFQSVKEAWHSKKTNMRETSDR